MTVSNSTNISDKIKQILVEIKFLYTKKILIIASIFVGLILGFFYHKNQTDTSKAEFKNTCSIRSNAIHNEILIDFINTIKGMDNITKARELNTSVEIASHLKDINPILIPLSNLPSDLYITNTMQIQINYTNRSTFNNLLKGIIYYLNSREYVKEKIKKYNIIKQSKIQLLHYIDNEVKKIDKNEFKSMTIFQEYNDKNTADLYKFKQKLEAETIDYPTIDVINKGVAIYANETPNIKIYLFAFGLIGLSLSIAVIYLIESLKKINIH